MLIEVTKQEGTLTKYDEAGNMQTVAITSDDYPFLQAFLNDCCNTVKTSEVVVCDQHEGYKVSLQVPAYAGDLMPAYATVFYDQPVNSVEGLTVLADVVKVEIDTLTALVP